MRSCGWLQLREADGTRLCCLLHAKTCVCVCDKRSSCCRRDSARLSAASVLLPLHSPLSVIYRLLRRKLLWRPSENRFLSGPHSGVGPALFPLLLRENQCGDAQSFEKRTKRADDFMFFSSHKRLHPAGQISGLPLGPVFFTKLEKLHVCASSPEKGRASSRACDLRPLTSDLLIADDRSPGRKSQKRPNAADLGSDLH